MQTLDFFFAYLDAGTGSMILQVVLGGAAAVGVGGRVLWQRMTGGKKTTEETTPDSESEAATE